LDKEVNKHLDKDITRFIYHLDTEEGRKALRVGLEHFASTYPYVITFMYDLLKLKVEAIKDERCASHEVNLASSQNLDGYVVKRFDLLVTGQIRTSIITITNPYSQIRIAFPYDIKSKKIKSVEGLPRLFNLFPLIKTKILNLPFIVDAPFETDDDRLEVSYLSEKRGLLPPILQEIMKIVEVGFKWAVEEGVSNPEELLVISTPPSDIGIYYQEWVQALTQLARTFAYSKTVRVRDSNGNIQFEYPSNVDFPSAKVDGEKFEDPHFLQILASIAGQLKFKLPLPEIIAKWDIIRGGWETLGIQVGKSLTLKRLTTYIESFKNLENLSKATGVTVEELKKLLEEFYELADIYRRAKGVPSFLRSAIYCSQTGSFKLPNEIYIDAGVPEELKKISKGIGFPLEDDLLIPTKEELNEYFKSLGIREINKEGAIKDIYMTIESKWKLLEGCPVFRQNVMLFERWLLQQEDIDALLEKDCNLRKLPWLCEDDKLRIVGTDPFLLPPALLDENKSSYVEIWPKDVRLSREYAQNLEKTSLFKKRVVEYGVGCEDFVREDEVTLQKEDLKVLAVEYRSSEPVRSKVSKLVAGERLMASLQEESSYQRTLRFVEFLLKYLVLRDESCLKTIEVETRVPGIRTVQKLTIYPCLWLSQVKRTSWVLNTDRQETEEPSKANLMVYLKEIEPTLLMNPKIQTFLEKHFYISQLDLAILAITREKKEVAESLTRTLVELLKSGIDVEYALTELREILHRKIDQEKVNSRNRNIGRLVERIVMKAFEKLKLDESLRIRVEPYWISYDFAAYVEAKAFEETDAGRLDFVCTSMSGDLLARFEVEVKATTVDKVRMTRTQAEESALKKDRYLLCVLDLGGLPIEILEELANRQLKEDIETLADKLRSLIYLSYVGEYLAPIIKVLDDLTVRAQPISISLNPTFIIPSSIWKGNGVSLESWASSLLEKFAK